MVLRTVFLPAACYTVPSSAIPNFSSLSLSCPFESSEKVLEIDENEISNLLPKFASADQDWKCFGYLLNEQPSTSSVQKRVTVFPKPVEPIGKGTRRRRRNADMEIVEEAASKPKAEVKKEVINPADITLGGDTFDYKEQKPFDSIATGVARRRRTSANLSKSEDETEKSATRPTKERRTSPSVTPQRTGVTYYIPGIGSQIDIDLAMPHCTCQLMFDSTRIFICCDMCARWYHGDCVGVTERMCYKLDQWTCEQCNEEQERCKEQPALYCVCKKPYDDTKFYVGCDSCQGWFHPECVGTTREESEQAAEYNCPNCLEALGRGGGGYESDSSEASNSSLFNTPLTRADYKYVMELLELLLEHRMSTPFRNPVDPNENPDYDKYVKKPMDLSTISKKVESLKYSYLGEFVNDVNLMFENAKTYNPKDNAVFKCAETMQEVFDKRLQEVRDEMRIHLFQSQPIPMSSARKRVQSESQKTVDSLDIDPDQLLPLDANFMSQYLDY